MRALKLHPETKVYLGLVHLHNGADGARKRIAAARHAVSDFDIATECGTGRRPPDIIRDRLRQHGEVAA